MGDIYPPETIKGHSDLAALQWLYGYSLSVTAIWGTQHKPTEITWNCHHAVIATHRHGVLQKLHGLALKSQLKCKQTSVSLKRRNLTYVKPIIKRSTTSKKKWIHCVKILQICPETWWFSVFQKSCYELSFQCDAGATMRRAASAACCPRLCCPVQKRKSKFQFPARPWHLQEKRNRRTQTRLHSMEPFSLGGAHDMVIFGFEGNGATSAFGSFHSDVPDVEFSALLWGKYPNQTELSWAVLEKKTPKPLKTIRFITKYWY